MIDFKGLETFLWVATLGSFRGAAQKLNTTQPAISQRIAQLEAEFGAKLLSRDARSVSPTPAGRQLLVYAERLIAIRADMIATVRDRSAIRGVMRIGVAETIVHTWLPRFIKAVKQTYPALSLEIEVDITPSLRTRLLGQEIDLAFLLGPVTGPEVRNRILSIYPVVFVASPALALPRPATIHDLAGVPIITFPRRTQPYEIVKSLFARQDLAHVNLNTSASLATVRLLALEGLGVAVVPRELVRQDLADGSLVLIDTDITVPDLSFAASWLASPDTLPIEMVTDIAVGIAQDDEARDA